VTPWAVRLPLASAAAAAALRLRTGISAAEQGQWLWLRGEDLDDALDLELRKLPGAVRYLTGPAGTVTEIGRRLPGGELPDDVRWVPLSAWAEVKPQPAALGGEPPVRASLRLERVAVEQPATVLVTTAAAFAEYADSAPLIRLRPLRIAAASDGRAILRGEPLPPLPGRRYAEREGIAVPCGFGFSPALEPAVLRELLDTTPDDLALFHEDGSYERVAAASFARASRGTARATLAALAGRGAAR
jgi:hypothetical protein